MHYSRIQSLTLDVLSTSELLVRGFLHLGGALHLLDITFCSGSRCTFQPSSSLCSAPTAHSRPRFAQL